MKIENKLITEFHSSELKNASSLQILNSLINKLNFDFFESNIEITIENCIIQDFLIHSCWFEKGLLFKNNHVINPINYQMGGHNKSPIVLIGNIFCEYVNFFDCHFDDVVIIKNNHFYKGSNIIGNLSEGFENLFPKHIITENNIGDINLDGNAPLV